MLLANNINFLKSLILELLVLLQPTFLDLPNLLHFTLYSVKLLGLLSITLDSLNFKSILHFSGKLLFFPLCLA